MNANATYRTMYANHKDERCEVLEDMSTEFGGSFKVLFEDGQVEVVPAGTIILDD